MNGIKKKSAKILFMGDSITDAGVWEDPEKVGNGYVRFIRDYFLAEYPEKNFRIVNKGIGGQRSSDLLARWQKDVVEERPDLLSLCVGANDIWRQYDSDLDVSTPEIFEQNLREMLRWTRDTLAIPVILMEIQPFEDVCLAMTQWPFTEDLYYKGGAQVVLYNAVIRSLSAEFGAVLCPVNQKMMENRTIRPDIRYTKDGVHPNSAGIVMIGLCWLESLGLHKSRPRQ